MIWQSCTSRAVPPTEWGEIRKIQQGIESDVDSGEIYSGQCRVRANKRDETCVEKVLKRIRISVSSVRRKSLKENVLGYVVHEE